MNTLLSLRAELGSEWWFVVVSVLAGMVGRVGKRWLRAEDVPAATIAGGAAIAASFALAVGEPLREAAIYGCGAGVFASGSSHELLKKTFVRLAGAAVGEHVATRLAELLLGKSPDRGPLPSIRKLPSAAVVLLGALVIGGCGGALGVLAKVAQGAGYLGTVLDVARGGANAFFSRHPNPEREQAVDAAELRARKALAALQGAVAAGEAADQRDIDRARGEALASYRELRGLLDGMGVLDARAPEGGAETELAKPEPLPLPTAEELEERL